MHWIDPEGLPETRGTVSRFLLNPHGEIDGIVLGTRDMRLVHVPPHLSKRIERHVAVGDTIRVRGVKPRGADLIAAVELVTRQGAVILDEGPQRDGEKHGKPHVEHEPMETGGKVVLSLYGPKGSCAGRCWRTAPPCACRRTRPASCGPIWCRVHGCRPGAGASRTVAAAPSRWTRSPS